VPIFEYLYHICEDEDASMRSLSDVCLLLDYRTYTPGATIIGYPTPPPTWLGDRARQGSTVGEAAGWLGVTRLASTWTDAPHRHDNVRGGQTSVSLPIASSSSSAARCRWSLATRASAPTSTRQTPPITAMV